MVHPRDTGTCLQHIPGTYRDKWDKLSFTLSLTPDYLVLLINLMTSRLCFINLSKVICTELYRKAQWQQHLAATLPVCLGVTSVEDVKDEAEESRNKRVKRRAHIDFKVRRGRDPVTLSNHGTQCHEEAATIGFLTNGYTGVWNWVFIFKSLCIFN